jgi:hypothetical protein
VNWNERAEKTADAAQRFIDPITWRGMSIRMIDNRDSIRYVIVSVGPQARATMSEVLLNSTGDDLLRFDTLGRAQRWLNRRQEQRCLFDSDTGLGAMR